MKFYIKIISLEGDINRLFGKSMHVHQLLSICVLADNGYKYYAINKDFSQSLVDRTAHDNLIPQLPRRDSNIYKSLYQIGSELKDFVRFHAANMEVEFYGYQSSVDTVLLGSIFHGMNSAMYPDFFPKEIIDLHQHTAVYLSLLPAEHFINYDKYGVTPFPEALQKVQARIDTFETHADYPEMDRPYNVVAMAEWIYYYYKFLIKFTKELSIITV
jgi:hypothetical protein